jgi:hypothetical protein
MRQIDGAGCRWPNINRFCTSDDQIVKWGELGDLINGAENMTRRLIANFGLRDLCADCTISHSDSYSRIYRCEGLHHHAEVGFGLNMEQQLTSRRDCSCERTGLKASTNRGPIPRWMRLCRSARTCAATCGSVQRASGVWHSWRMASRVGIGSTSRPADWASSWETETSLMARRRSWRVTTTFQFREFLLFVVIEGKS